MFLHKAITNQLKTALKMATAMLSIVAFTPCAYGATFKSQSSTWSSAELSDFSADYELVQQSERQSDRPEIQGISWDVSSENGESVSYFQNLMNTARQLRVSGTRATEGTNVPILPQVEYSQINEGVYDFDVNRQNQGSRRGLTVRPSSSGSSARGPRRFKPSNIIDSRRQQTPRRNLDLFSFRLRQFGGEAIENEFVNLPRSEFLLSVNRYYGDISNVKPMMGSFGTLEISVKMPTLPQQSLGDSDKYFKSSKADVRAQQNLQRQVDNQMKQQEKRLKKWNKGTGRY